MNKKTVVWIAVIFICVANTFALNEKAIIDGTAQFLIERAQQNYLYIFEKKIKDNKLFTSFFPKTTYALGNMSLSLLLTNQKYIKENIVADMNGLRDSITYLAIENSKKFIIDRLNEVGDTLYVYNKLVDTALLHQVEKSADSLTVVIKKFRRNRDSMLVYVRNISDLLDTTPVFDMLFKHCMALLGNPIAAQKIKDMEIVKFLGNSQYYRRYINELINNIEITCDTSRSFSTRVSSALTVINNIGKHMENKNRYAKEIITTGSMKYFTQLLHI